MTKNIKKKVIAKGSDVMLKYASSLSGSSYSNKTSLLSVHLPAGLEGKVVKAAHNLGNWVVRFELPTDCGSVRVDLPLPESELDTE
jgi:hypothetical protein